MNNAALLCMMTAGSTMLWVVQRWAMRSGCRPAVYGLCYAMTAVVLGGIATAAAQQPLNRPTMWAIGAMSGVASGFGWCLLVPYCVKIGPVGPTAAMNNLGMVWPVMLSVLWLKPVPMNPWLVTGLVLVIAALVAFGFASAGKNAQGRAVGVTARWFGCALLAWVMTGTAQTGHVLASLHAHDAYLAMYFLWGVMAAAVLAPMVLAMRAKPTKREITAGVLNGAITAVTLPAVIFVLHGSIGAVLVFPITIAGPLIPILLLGHWVYKERLRPLSLLASAVAIAGLVLLCIGAKLAEERQEAPPALAGYRISTIRTAPAGTTRLTSAPPSAEGSAGMSPAAGRSTAEGTGKRIPMPRTTRNALVREADTSG